MKNCDIKKNKIILIGDGAVGSSYAYALTLQGIGRELGIIDVNENKALGDALDLSDALAFCPPKTIYRATYADCKDAEVVAITAGLAQKPGETRLDLVDKNLKIFKQIITAVVDSGFKGIFLIASNPVDIMTYATYKFSGFHFSRVIGTGTSLDSSRFRQEISKLLNVDPRNVHAYIMGEHGDTEFPVWSHANVGGISLYEWVQEHSETDRQKLHEAFLNVKNAAYRIIDLKGATFYGIGASMARITKAILNDENAILPVSAYLKGEYGLNDIFIGAPAILNSNGLRWVMDIPLDDKEKELMNKSYQTLRDIIDKSFAKLETESK